MRNGTGCKCLNCITYARRSLVGRTPKLFTSLDGHVFAVCAGQPANDLTWPSVTRKAMEAINRLQSKLAFKSDPDRRGSFQTVASGISYGGGQRRPGNLDVRSKRNKLALEEFYSDPNIKRIVGFGNSMFAFYFPKIYKEYADTMKILEQKYPHFRRNDPRSIFAAATVNFGPRVVTHEHFDSGNRANGICPIWCAGSFDHRKGGHLILRQLKKIVQFPAGSMILIPSATLMHGNIDIHSGETRVSFTQYSAGGLARWIVNGFQTEKRLEISNPTLFAKLQDARPTAWKAAVQAFSKVDELHADRIAAGIVRAP